MADEREVTRDDMEAAAERIAERDGVTVEEVRERVRRVDAAERSRRASVGLTERSCGLDGCDRTFVPKNARHEYCSRPHRSAAFRARRRNAP